MRWQKSSMTLLSDYHDLLNKLVALRQAGVSQAEQRHYLTTMDGLYRQMTPEESSMADALYRDMTDHVPTHDGLLAIEKVMLDAYGESAWCLATLPTPPRWPAGASDAEDVRLALEWDLRTWAQTFFPDLCAVPWSSMHDDFFTRHAQRHGARGWRDVTAAPRGHGKTTVKGKLEILHDIVYRHERYIGICSANADLARDKVKDIRDALADNMELRRVYGPLDTREWRMADFITKNGVRCRAFTPRSKVRGFLWHGQRLTKIVLDDAEDPEMMLTELRRQRFSQWFKSDVSKLGDGDTNFDVIGTILHPQSLLSELLDNPGFTPSRYQAVIAFADGQDPWDLWRQWRDIIVNLSDPHRLHHGRQFYLDHEEAMMHGVEALWPARESYYELMLNRIIEGEASFWMEKQNEPLSDERYIFDMDHAAYCRIQPDGIIRADGTMIPFVSLHDSAAYWDPTPPKKEAAGHDYACCVVAMKDQHGYIYIVDTYIDQEISTTNQIDAIVDLLWRWHVPMIGIESNGFATLLTSDMRESIAKRAQEEGIAWNVDLMPIVNTRNKVLRIRTLEPLVSNGWLQFSNNLHAEFYRQFAEFLPIADAGFDDAPDAVNGVVRVIKGLWDRRSVS